MVNKIKQRSKKRGLGPLWFMLTVLATAGFLSLASWQYERAQEKKRLIAKVEQQRQRAPLTLAQLMTLDATTNKWHYQKLTAQGRYLGGQQILLDNMVRKGKPGYEVLTPFKLSNGQLIMVNRGWVPWVGTRDNIPLIDVPAEEITLQATAYKYLKAGIVMEQQVIPDTPSWPLILNFPSQQAIDDLYLPRVLPIIARLQPEQPYGFDRSWLLTGVSIDKHLGYALQWLALAITCIVLFVVLSVRTAFKE